MDFLSRVMTRKKRTIKGNPCHGIPTEIDYSLPFICDSRGIGRWKKIVVGRAFFTFDDRQQSAFLLHEVAHCKLRHLEKRIAALWLLIWRPKRLAQLCIEQEFEADLFVARCGFGPDLARAFLRIGSAGEDPLHPPLTARVERLQSAS